MQPDVRLTRWLESAGLSLVHLKVYEEPGGFAMDFSAGSLARVGEIVVDRAEPPATEPGLAQAAAAYLGEVLLRTAGGGWTWADDRPAIEADPVLDLPREYPTDLVDRAIQEGDDSLFVDAYERWERASARYRAEHPGWSPTKRHTPGIDPAQPRSADAEYLATWLAERERVFPEWAARHAAHGPWDFSVDSLDRLEDLLATLTVEELQEPAQRELVDGAVWYVGETLRRIRGGEWVYRRQDPAGPPDPYAGDPFVRPAAGRGTVTTPIVTIRRVVAGARGALRARYLNWAR
jgi:hypothetical protein